MQWNQSIFKYHIYLCVYEWCVCMCVCAKRTKYLYIIYVVWSTVNIVCTSTVNNQTAEHCARNITFKKHKSSYTQNGTAA